MSVPRAHSFHVVWPEGWEEGEKLSGFGVDTAAWLNLGEGWAGVARAGSRKDQRWVRVSKIQTRPDSLRGWEGVEGDEPPKRKIL